MRRLAILLLASTAAAQSPVEGRPRHNATFVPADDEPTRALTLGAEEAARNGDFAGAAARLQELVLSTRPAVVAIRGREVFVSPHRWAQLQLLAERDPFPREVLDAWRRMHDADAEGAIRGALAVGDEAALLTAVDRYPAATPVPAALLALADRAFQRGDVDLARGHLDRVPEHLARSEEGFLASAEFTARARLLAGRVVPAPHGWPTEGGDATRARRGDAIPPPGELQLLWSSPLLEQVPEIVEAERRHEPAERSLDLPFEPVVGADWLCVHLGTAVAIYDRANGKLQQYAGSREPGVDEVGTAIQRSPGARAATLHGDRLYFDQLTMVLRGDVAASNRLVAFDVPEGRTAWTAPGPRTRADPVLARGVFFRGAPAIDHGRVYAYGAVREREGSNPTRKEEAYLFCFREADGELLWKRFLGYGDTDAPPEFPPLSGLAPAVSRGVVVAVSGLGVAAAMDARTGDVLWLLRYGRMRPEERERLTDLIERTVPVRSAWLREPPRIVGDSTYFAPFDSEELHACWLRGRRDPSTGEFHVSQWEKHRARHHRNCRLETIGGIAGGRILLVGLPDERSFPAYESVVSVRLADGLGAAYGRLPATEREDDGPARPPALFGRPTIAGDALLVPTPRRLFRFRADAVQEGPREGELARDVEPLGSDDAASLPDAEALDPNTDEPLPVFGSLVAVDGFLYAATADRVLAFGRKKAE